jgi:hypothetical protein
MRSPSIRALAFALLLAAIGRPAAAVVVITGSAGNYSVTQIYTTDSAYTGGTYNGSGDQYEGLWQNGAGTAVSPHAFLTATHLGGSVGQVFNFGGSSYKTVGSTDVGNGMTLWSVNGTFGNYAPIDANGTTAANSVQGSITSDFGYGVYAGVRTGPSGTPTFSTSPVTGPDGIQGYTWGGSPGFLRLSWGLSSVNSYVTNSNLSAADANQLGTYYLSGAFLPSLGTGNMSATFTQNDSGGGVFVKKDGVWQLVGVNLGVDGGYYQKITGANGQVSYQLIPGDPHNAGVAGNAAVFDQTGLYFKDGSSYVPAGTGPQNWYADAITPTVFNSIQSAVPEPATISLLAAGLGLFALARRRRRRKRPASP